MRNNKDKSKILTATEKDAARIRQDQYQEQYAQHMNEVVSKFIDSYNDVLGCFHRGENSMHFTRPLSYMNVPGVGLYHVSINFARIID